jgi:streptogramin lyase
MRWFFCAGKSLRRPSRELRRAPKRKRSLILEGLEGRQLLSQAIQPFVTLNIQNTISNMVAGPNGDLWVGASTTDNTAAAAIDRIGRGGSIRSFPVPGNGTGGGAVLTLSTGPDGNVWFEAAFNATDAVIGNVTPAARVSEVTDLPLSPELAGGGALEGGAQDTSIVSGPDGDFWFGYTVFGSHGQNSDYIGRMTTAGAVKLFPISSVSSGPITAYPPTIDSLAAGADGNLWFTESVGDSGNESVFGRMSPSGVVTDFPVPELSEPSVGNEPNGTLVVYGQTLSGQNEVFQVSTAGAVTRYKIPAANSGAFLIYQGWGDGSLWFTNDSLKELKIGRITVSGKATSYYLPNFDRGRADIIQGMALGQDGKLYLLDQVTERSGQQFATVYRLSPSKLPPVH